MHAYEMKWAIQTISEKQRITLVIKMVCYKVAHIKVSYLTYTKSEKQTPLWTPTLNSRDTNEWEWVKTSKIATVTTQK